MGTYRGRRFRPADEDASGLTNLESKQTNDHNSTQDLRPVREPRRARTGGAEPAAHAAQSEGTRAARTAGAHQARSAHTPRRSASRGAHADRTARVERSASRSATGSHMRQADPEAFKHHDALYEDGGPRRSRAKTLLIAIPIALVVIALLVAGGMALFNFATAEGESNVEAGIAVTVDIPNGSGLDAIANILKEHDVISSTKEFKTEVQNRGLETSLQAGTYELTTLMDMDALISLLAKGPVILAEGNLTIPEGYTVEQTAAAVEAATGIPQADFLARAYAANEYVADYPFLEGVYNNSLEGFLYPKTYSIPDDADADYVVRVLLDQFVIETSNLDMSTAEANGLSLFEVITMASLIERETAVDSERANIASVINNRRLDGMLLQIDATVVYAMGGTYGDEGVVYENDLTIDSPYNTYQNYGLPAGPICSPSIASIEAAAHPAETNYYYYVLSAEGNGTHVFCATENEFWAAKEEYDASMGL